ncbi:MAG: hypothetical protein LBI61_01540 [Puniceicoccales bacterium]|nr:hypothetical protein [Puniceicoccales bacterium]
MTEINVKVGDRTKLSAASATSKSAATGKKFPSINVIPGRAGDKVGNSSVPSRGKLQLRNLKIRTSSDEKSELPATNGRRRFWGKNIVPSAGAVYGKNLPTLKVSKAALMRAAIESKKEDEVADNSMKANREADEEFKKEEEISKNDVARIGQEHSNGEFGGSKAKQKTNGPEERAASAKKTQDLTHAKIKSIAPQIGKLKIPGNRIAGKPLPKRS